MIINFSVANWLSFKGKASLSMVATNFRNHGDRLPKIKKFQADLLPVSIIFGGNASGKSNFVKALKFARDFVLDGTKADQPINVLPYVLDSKTSKRDTKFEFELLIDDNIFEFCFSLNRNRVSREKLVSRNSTSEELLYDRTVSGIKFGDSIGNGRFREKLEFLNFVARGTRANQLFITNSILQNEKLFRPVYNWFAKTLAIVGPNSRFDPYHYYLDKKNSFGDFMNEVIPKLDVGISSIQSVSVPIELIDIPGEMYSDIIEETNENSIFLLDIIGDLFLISRENGEVVAKKLTAQHFTSDGHEMNFDFQKESDGTKRVMDLLPAFYNLLSKNQVVFIDEIDRSVHSTLVHRLLDSYIENCHPGSRSQLIFTTHNLEVMDNHMVRPDEIWVTEMDMDGATSLHSLSEYKDSLDDQNFRESYLQGRFGGVPDIQIGGILSIPKNGLNVE